jgi:hypothetical protein
MEGV